MKKILALLLICIMAFAVVSCDEPEPSTEFSVFEKAIDQTPAAKVKVLTKITTEIGVLNSTVETVFNPDGSANISYTVEKFNSDFTSPETVITKSGVVTLNKDGNYSDGGEFQGALGENIASVNLNLEASKLESYSIEGGILTATVKAENTAAVLGAAIGADVSLMLTTSNNRVISIVINYTTELGTVEAIVSYN